MTVVRWLRRGLERARAERDAWPRWLRRNVEEMNDMADSECNECNPDSIDNGDGIDQCIVWPCHEDRMRVRKVEGSWTTVTSLHCEAHQGFAHVDQTD